MDWPASQQDDIEADARFLMLAAITHHKRVHQAGRDAKHGLTGPRRNRT